MSSQDFTGKRIAIYARFSSQLQREASIEDQVRRCRSFVADRGGAVPPAFVFTDSAISGSSTLRPSFERMMALVTGKPSGIDVIVTEDMSRISRDFADSALIFKRLQFQGVPLIGVGDGIDTSARHAKMAFTLKSLMSDMYIDELRDKTLRGLEGRALAGYSTGGLPLGYRSESVRDHYGQIVGHKIVVDEEASKVVRYIFKLYVDGNSLESVARRLNAERVPPPRAKTRHRRKGWVASTVRAMLHNEAYIGWWTFNRRQWMKVPGTNIRRPKPKDSKAVIRREHKDRRIVDEALWTAAQERLAAIRACYVRPGRDNVGAVHSGRRNRYALSGLLRCGVCGAPMTIHGGSSASYYRCSDQKKRGTCSNAVSLREDVMREALMGALRNRYGKPSAVMYLRKKIAEQLGATARQVNAAIDEHRQRLERIEHRIAGLIRFISDGDDSEYIRKSLKDLEAQAGVEKATIATLRQRAERPIELPTPEEVIRCIDVLEEVMAADPVLAREHLGRLFEGGRLMLTPQDGRTYLAKGRLDLGQLLTMRFDVESTAAEGNAGWATKSRNFSWSSDGCAGRI
jgi:DNA invertase Pin-like site-specific DNA recombinase